jgi:predicted aspartyl protease
MTRKIVLLVFLSFWVSIGACHAQNRSNTLAEAPNSGTSQLEVPLMCNPPGAPWPVIFVSINGKEPLPFMVDTGVDTAVILDIWAAERLKLSFHRKNGNVNSRETRTAVVDTVTLSGTTDKGEPAIYPISLTPNVAPVADLSFWNGNYSQSAYGGHKLAGFIGVTCLVDSICTFDFGAKKLIFREQSAKSQAVRHKETSLQKPSAKLTFPMVMQDTTHSIAYYVSAGIGETQTLLLLDTGSDSTSLPLSSINSLASLKYSSAWKLGSSKTDTFEFTDKILTDNFRIGNQSISNVPVKLTAQSEGVIGMDTLFRFRVTFDFSNKLLHLEPRNFTFTGIEGSSIVKIAYKNKRYTVSELQPGSPAGQAGVQLGDEVKKIDGTVLTAADQGIAQRLLDGYGGQRAWLLLNKNDGRQVSVSFIRKADRRNAGASIGLSFVTQNSYLFISNVLPDSPGGRAGLKVGDWVRFSGLEGSFSAYKINQLLLQPQLDLIIGRQDSPAPLQFHLEAPQSNIVK